MSNSKKEELKNNILEGITVHIPTDEFNEFFRYLIGWKHEFNLRIMRTAKFVSITDSEAAFERKRKQNPNTSIFHLLNL